MVEIKPPQVREKKHEGMDVENFTSKQRKVLQPVQFLNADEQKSTKKQVIYSTCIGQSTMLRDEDYLHRKLVQVCPVTKPMYLNQLIGFPCDRQINY